MYNTGFYIEKEVDIDLLSFFSTINQSIKIVILSNKTYTLIEFIIFLYFNFNKQYHIYSYTSSREREIS